MAGLRRDPGLRIGIIGVGRVGHLLATFLLRYADVFPDELFLVSSSMNSVRELLLLFDHSSPRVRRIY